MYNAERKQYIFKQSSGKTWNLFHSEKLGICYSTLTRKNTWTEPVSIRKNCYPTFYADMDSNDCFHLIFQDNKGNIFYQYINQDIVRTLPILNSKFPSVYNKNLFLIPAKNSVHMFFTIHYNQDMILAHQILSGNTPGKPKVIDYVNKTLHPFSICCDKETNMYAFYQSSDGKHLQLGYKKFISNRNLWGEFTPVTKYNGDCEYPRCILDFNNILHLSYQRRSSKQYELVYLQKLQDKNLWTDEVVLHTSAYPFTDCSILYLNGNIYIYWIREDTIYFTTSKEDGKQWSKPSKCSFSGGKQIFCSLYKSNSSFEADRILIREIPVSFINGYKLPFCQEISNDINTISQDELRNTIVESLSLLKSSVDELKESNTGILQSISQITNTQQNLDREITKYSLRVNHLEKEITQLKSITNQLKDYRSMVNELLSRFKDPSLGSSDPLQKKKLKLKRFPRNGVYHFKVK